MAAEMTAPLPLLRAEPTADLNKWEIFSSLEEDFMSTVRIVYVFGEYGKDALLVDRNDDVYALGSTVKKYLGLSDVSSTPGPMKVKPLCQKGIQGFACSFYCSPYFVMAVTLSGDLLSWGNNNKCQLGLGFSGTPPSQIGLTMRHQVAQVACGWDHTLALTCAGEVYAWGDNGCGQLGFGTTTNQPSPCKVTKEIGRERCVGIACCSSSSMALLESGEVFGWGGNSAGELGLGHNTNQTTPSRVTDLSGVVIQKVVCGSSHAMALSNEGVLYTWGNNSYGQLGTGNTEGRNCPFKMPTNMGRVVEIAASCYSGTSAAATQAGKVYRWGEWKDGKLTSPTETPFDSIHDVLAHYANPAITWKPIKLDMSRSNKAWKSLKMAFNDSSTSDLKFCVEGKLIYVHKVILKFRSEHFYSMFQSHWQNDKETLDITTYPYNVYNAFLEYLYTGEVQLPLEDAIGLLDLANAYGETELKHLCERVIKTGIRVENVATVYAAAIKCDAKELEEFCLRFAQKHMTAVVRTEAFDRLEGSIIKTFVSKAADYGAFKY